MSAVILFGGGLQTLSLARGLKKDEGTIINVGDAHAVGRYSRFIDIFVEVELGSLSENDLLRIIRENNVNVIIPTEDEFAEWLSCHKDKIESLTEACCAIVNPELFQQVINKSVLLDVCRKNCIPHPKTISLSGDVNDLTDIESIFPALIKPDVSNGARGICPVNNISELKEKLSLVASQFGKCSLQEFIYNPSHYYNCMLYRYADGTYGPGVVTKITRFYPIKGGSSSFCTTIENPAIVKICSDLLDVLGWVGFADFDVLEKGHGDYRIIEINPRVPASLHAAFVSGIDFGKIIVSDLIGRARPNMMYTPGQHLRFLGLDIAWFLSSPNRFKSQPSWFKFWGRDLHYQEGGIKDWKAMVYSIWSGIKKQLSPSFRKAKAGMN